MSTDAVVQISNNEAGSRYVATVDGGPVGTAAYERSSDSITFTHTVVDPDVEVTESAATSSGTHSTTPAGST
ncbi:putative GNAT family acetyltransferase [Arthrobacter sp. CAN_A2]|uniref:GNAT family N-acetyltransferase n=1 Tax=Arthrobacter sp. CAN_A2 TaxID=2787718 RepID=UPI001A290155